MVARIEKRSIYRCAGLGVFVASLVAFGISTFFWRAERPSPSRVGLSLKPLKGRKKVSPRRSLARRFSAPSLPEIQSSSKKLRADPATARGASAIRVEINSSFLSKTESAVAKWSGIPGVTASGEVLPEGRFYRNAATSGDWLTEIGMAQREFESRDAHGLVGAFQEKEQADRMASYASRIGSEVVAYHVGYQRKRAAQAATQLVDRNSEVYQALRVPVGGAIAVAAWGSGTPIEFGLLDGVRLKNETSLMEKTTRVAVSSALLNSDLRVDFSNPEWSWYGASVSRGLLLDGLSAKLSSVRPVSPDQTWNGQGPVSEDAVSLEYKLRF